MDRVPREKRGQGTSDQPSKRRVPTRIIKLAEKYNLQKNVLFFDKVNQQDVANYMNSSKILLMASTSEGLPRVLIESGLCGLPSVASNIEWSHGDPANHFDGDR